ncbi:MULTISPECIES: STAS/SEC14 domain-containing protein [Ramlibacter]|uniref:STAS/SEC14 domain-containing protein n=1 Tax=Ramlibacter aquaticus TaxID=2780094 RepID=A0ABR9SB12_9BURK|nr:MULTISPECIES: STAS/SEC14 domain-containing protein [Ramlibacter]MBE7939525.1 STAS/SEC14 domain-containing protein [Ramlibacter aquaticus]
MLKFELGTSEGCPTARLEGLVSVEAWASVLEDLDRSLQAHAGPPRLLMDLTPLLGYLGVPERQAVGALMAHHLARMHKVALVVQAHKISNVVHDEAQRQGLDLRLFSSKREALAWIHA